MMSCALNYRALLTVFVCASVLAGCGGSSSGTSSAESTGSGATSGGSPTVSLNTSASSVSAGDSVTLNWSSTNADSCEASGGWSGGRSLSGSQTVGPIQQTTTFTLSCSGSGGGAVRQVEVQVANGGADTSVSLSASPENVVEGGSTTLSWNSSDATSCSASGAWSGNRGTDGSEVVGPLSRDTTYQLTCEGPSGSAVAMVTVRTADKTLRWQAPTQNVDGTPLTDLAGYKVYWGQTSRSYSGSQSINSPSTTQWEVTLAPGEYYFAMTAIDSENNESGYSNEVLKLIP